MAVLGVLLAVAFVVYVDRDRAIDTGDSAVVDDPAAVLAAAEEVLAARHAQGHLAASDDAGCYFLVPDGRETWAGDLACAGYRQLAGPGEEPAADTTRWLVLEGSATSSARMHFDLREQHYAATASVFPPPGKLLDARGHEVQPEPGAPKTPGHWHLTNGNATLADTVSGNRRALAIPSISQFAPFSLGSAELSVGKVEQVDEATLDDLRLLPAEGTVLLDVPVTASEDVELVLTSPAIPARDRQPEILGDPVPAPRTITLKAGEEQHLVLGSNEYDPQLHLTWQDRQMTWRLQAGTIHFLTEADQAWTVEPLPTEPDVVPWPDVDVKTVGHAGSAGMLMLSFEPTLARGQRFGSDDELEVLVDGEVVGRRLWPQNQVELPGGLLEATIRVTTPRYDAAGRSLPPHVREFVVRAPR